MLNFTVGPVQCQEKIREIGYEQVPYFRTQEFSNIMLENEKLMKQLAKAEEDARVVFLTCSGTGAMEATVMNTLTNKDNVLIVNGGSFGQRFVDLCKLHNIMYSEIKLDYGKTLTKEELEKFDGKDYTAFIVNVHETSTGVHYDMNLIKEFCDKNKLMLIVDAISSFLADEFNMKELNVDVMITSSQKALACPPGISILVLSKMAIEKINENVCKCMYFDLKNALTNAERGQTPFTPAVSILRQINARLKEICKEGGVEIEINRVRKLADYFRNGIKDLPLQILTETPSNAVTALHPINKSAYSIFLNLKDNYNIWVCPNGGALKDKIFRVGHIGALEEKDYDVLLNALHELNDKNLL